MSIRRSQLKGMAISELNSVRAAGIDGLSAEHLILGWHEILGPACIISNKKLMPDHGSLRHPTRSSSLLTPAKPPSNRLRFFVLGKKSMRKTYSRIFSQVKKMEET